MTLFDKKTEKRIEDNKHKQRVLILGADGYIGVALYQYLDEKDYLVIGIDNNMRERNVINYGSDSIIRASKPADIKMDISLDYNALKELIASFHPTTIINLAQQPSAPWSMISAENARETQRNNVCGGLNLLWAVHEVDPSIHIIQLGTAGEFAASVYSEVEIPEGPRITVKYNDKDWVIPTPRYAGSAYHWSKVFSSFNADYFAQLWGMRFTDINQGIVYGHYGNTRFDIDDCFGTIINRFVAQAVVGMPLTIYGEGNQARSMINIKNSLQAIELLINNPASNGEYRTIHQLTEVYTPNQVAEFVKDATECTINHIDNPRVENENHNFVFEAKKLKTLGLRTITLIEELPRLVDIVQKHKDNIKLEVIKPKIKWK